ncbi:MAG: DUF6173 family protein [Candidatus Gracilibacteria bacterium]|nr:DUF6173 family protein [Candidatus Gracilibacteria bacterium]
MNFKDLNINLPKINIPKIDIPKMNLPNFNENMINIDMSGIFESQYRKNNPSSYLFDRIMEQIKIFEENLDENHEIGGALISSNYNTFYITKVKSSNPDMIIFYGKTENGPVQILQHISQINISLISLKKQKEHKEARRIGFDLD